MPKASIIIRAKNEEQWIKHCLRLIHAQTMQDFEIVLVDNRSEDATVDVARRIGIDKLITIAEFLPGRAINQGIAESSGDYLIILSAHCVPKDERWLETLLASCEEPQTAGVYGRQIPVSFTPDSDKRDLLITFGLDRRLQIKDYFFHNANSVVRRDVWERFPFDNDVTNIEDRIWAKEVISAGYQIVYEPDAVVYHHHGIHHDLDLDRARDTVSILQGIESPGDMSGLPETMAPDNVGVAAIAPVVGEVLEGEGELRLNNLIADLRTCRYVGAVYVFSESAQVKEVAERAGARFIERPSHLYPPNGTIEDVLAYALRAVEDGGDYPDVVLYANCLFLERPRGFFDTLVEEIQYKGLDTVFGGYPDYDNYWRESPEHGFEIIGDGMKPRLTKRPLYRALYGLGTVATAPQIRSGSMVGQRVGIVPISDGRHTVKVDPYA